MSKDQNRTQQDQQSNPQQQQPGQQNQQGERGQGGQGGDTTRNPQTDPKQNEGGLGTGVDTGDIQPGNTNGANT